MAATSYNWRLGVIVSVNDEDLGAEAPTALRGTLLKSAEAYH